jgi:protein-S-isoprenylcysteine O-methyltransferase Ste14
MVIFIFSTMNPQYIVLFEINHYVNYFFLSYGMFFFIWANISMETSLLIPFSFKTLLNKSELKIAPYDTVISDGITTKGMYGWMRHPMQSGCLFIIIFGSPIFTV